MEKFKLEEKLKTFSKFILCLKKKTLDNLRTIMLSIRNKSNLLVIHFQCPHIFLWISFSFTSICAHAWAYRVCSFYLKLEQQQKNEEKFVEQKMELHALLIRRLAYVIELRFSLSATSSSEIESKQTVYRHCHHHSYFICWFWYWLCTVNGAFYACYRCYTTLLSFALHFF